MSTIFQETDGAARDLISRLIREEFITKEPAFASVHLTALDNPNIVPLFKDGTLKTGGVFHPCVVKRISATQAAMMQDPPEYVVIISNVFWLSATDIQREAAIYRALCAFVIVENEKSGSMKVTLEKPGIQYYGEERERYGEWVQEAVLY